MTEPVALEDLIAQTRASLELANERRAKALGVGVDEMRRVEAARDLYHVRMGAIRASGIALAEGDDEKIARDEIRDSVAVRAVRKWCEMTPPPRPILIFAGALGVGKSFACGLAIALMGRGKSILSLALPRMIAPYRDERDAGGGYGLVHSSFVVLEDVGTRSAQDARWQDAFAEFVELRRAGKRTIITCNMPRRDLDRFWGARIADRMRQSAHVIEVGGESLRGGE